MTHTWTTHPSGARWCLACGVQAPTRLACRPVDRWLLDAPDPEDERVRDVFREPKES